MLIEFSVKNFMSFKDKVTLTMEKGTGTENPDNAFKINNLELLKTAAIYGANASGKSNLLKAFSCAILMIRTSNLMPINGKWNIIKPFLFDKNSNNKPSEFEFIILVNKIKYKYSFSADANNIYNESLSAYYTQKPTNIFTRTNINTYEFGIDKNKLEALTINNTANKLFLSTATTWNYDKTKDVFLWFHNAIDTYISFNAIYDQEIIEYKKDEKLKEFALKLLKEADILIKDIHVDYEKELTNSTVNNISSLLKNTKNYEIKNVNIELEHEVKDAKNNTHTYNLKIDDESSGTKALFALAPFLKRAFESPRVMLIDELEKSMHPAIIEFIIKLFNNKSINKFHSQLIFTTHATNLLNIEILRRDQVWFTEKNPDNGSSDLYPLDSFSVRKEENIEKGYLSGRYGAIPFIRDIDLW